MSKRVLFVDDEPRVLDALQRMLRPYRAELEMEFSSSGEDALKRFAEKPFEIIVSDIRMPGMDGAALLERVKKDYPDTIRFALSGQSDQETWMRSLGSAHQFLSKPCNAEKLRSAIVQASSLRDRLHSENVRNIVSGTGALPSLPHIYSQIMALMQKPDCSVGEVAAAVEQDVAMSAKVLQLVNSASVGLHNRISSPAQAVSLLGLGTLRAMLLLVHIFDNFRIKEPAILAFFSSFHSHSMAVCQASRRIAQMETQDKNLIQESAIAGMLHDVGRLIFASNFPERYAKILKSKAFLDERELVAAETEEFGSSHQEAGAYLLAIWGLSDPVVEAVAYHHQPLSSAIRTFSPLATVHFADCLFPPQPPDSLRLPPPAPSEPDFEFYSTLGLEGHLETWRHTLGFPPRSVPQVPQAIAPVNPSDKALP